MGLRYFGTDGIRGQAFAPPLTIEETFRWGRAWAKAAADNGIQTLVAGWDGRTSCEPLLRAFLAGFGRKIETVLLGIVPTPAVAWIVSKRQLAWGLVVSASHNPPEDNGLKGFDNSGEKLSEDVEQAIEAAFATAVGPSTDELALEQEKKLDVQQKEMESYLDCLGGIVMPNTFPIVVDCAHGATAPWAKRLFSGAVQWLGVPSIGEKINVGIGSTHIDAVRQKVCSGKAALGAAFDGDGDRCLMVTGSGELIDGDQMAWLLALDRHNRGEKPEGLIGTQMSNGGLEQGLSELEIPFLRTPVGDKYMIREMKRTGWGLAAEASGHIIQRNMGPSGDGMATALSVLRALADKPEADRWGWRFSPWPLELINIKTKCRPALEECQALQKAMKGIERELGGTVRLVVRWSGTEPLLRLMAEAKDGRQVKWALDKLMEAAKDDMLV